MSKFNPDKKDDDSPFSNGCRASIANEAVAFADREKSDVRMDSGLGDATASSPVDYDMVVDLLSDIAHLCDREEWDFKQMLDTVEMHHPAER